MYRRVSSWPQHPFKKPFCNVFPIEDRGPQGPAVHVSLSSDSPVKQPGNLAISLSAWAKSRRNHSLFQSFDRQAYHLCISEGFGGAPTRSMAGGASNKGFI